MSHRSLAVGLVVLLIASTLIAFAPALAHSAPPARTAASPGLHVSSQPAAAIVPTVINGLGYDTTYFYPGYPGWGTFYFAVTDPLDRAVNVTITDPNATRDGVSSPAFHYVATLNATTHSFTSYPSGPSGSSYKFPSVVYGGHWKVNFSATAGGTVDENLTLLIYSTSLFTSVGSGSTLPGQPFSVFWQTNLDVNNAPYTHATNVILYGSYTGNGTTQSLTPAKGIALSTPGAGFGQWSGTVPSNAGPNTLIHIEVSAITNVSGGIAENESSNITVRVGAVYIEGVGITGLPPTCTLVNDLYFTAGTDIAACIQAGSNYGGAFTPIPGLAVMVQYWNGTHHVSPVGAPTALTTNATGEAGFTFLANIPPFINYFTGVGLNALNFTVNVTGASKFYHWTAWSNDSFELYPPAMGTGIVQLSLDHSTYYVGDTGTATWAVNSTNFAQTGPLTAVRWQIVGVGTGIRYEQGTLNSTGASGSFTFPILESMVSHRISVQVGVVNATTIFWGVQQADVLAPALLLTPSNFYYTPSSSDPVTAVLVGGAAGATIQFQVWAYWQYSSAQILNGTVANNSNIPVSIGSVAPLEIYVDAWAMVGDQVVASQSTEMILEQGYSVLLSVGTTSSYSDGSFQPGQTVTLNYQVVSVGGAALPQRVSFELFADGYPYVQHIQNVGTSGSISFTIPSNAPQGALFLELYVTSNLGNGPCLGGNGCAAVTSLNVNPNPSVLNLELGAGSGLTVGWLILLILIVVIAVVLFFVIRGRGRRMKPSSAPSGATTSPPTEWKGPTPAAPSPETPAPEPSSSESPPPLPPPAQPPAGAT